MDGRSEANEKQRFNALDGLRGIAALSVMLNHFTDHTGSEIFGSSDLAVDLFFSLSGFVIAFSYYQKLEAGMKASEFLAKRLMRLYPMYIVGFGLGVFALLAKVLQSQTTLTLTNTVLAGLCNLLYLPYLHPYSIRMGHDSSKAIFPVNEPAWSLFFELCLNTVFALLVFSPWLFRRPWVLAIAGAVGLVAYERYTHADPPGWGLNNVMGGMPRSFLGFYGGVFLFSIFRTIKSQLPRVNSPLLMLLVLLMLAIPFNRSLWLLSALFAVPCIVALGSVAHIGSPFVRDLNDYLGWLSYPIYCVHFPVYSLFTTLTHNRDWGLEGAMLCTAISLPLAHMAAKYLEQPIRNALGTSFSRRRVADLRPA